MKSYDFDVVIVGAGGGGLRSAIAIAEKHPELKIALVSKVYPMRSHTVAAEGGAAGVYKDEDSYEKHFYDTVSGGDWLCEQDVVQYFVENSPKELTRLENWGCPWSRNDKGEVNVRPFGGMKVERTWFAADKTGFHILHTLFQTSLQFPSIHRFDEHFVIDILIDDARAAGVVALQINDGELVQINGKSVIIATGGAGRVFNFNTLGGIVTGDGMSICYRKGIPLRDMEFVQYHPTGLPGSGILMTEGCRGEGGILVNKNGYRYLQDYGLGPEIPVGQTKNKYMELGPRDRLSQAFWMESKKGNTFKDEEFGEYTLLDLTHLGEKKLLERLPFIVELSRSYIGVDPVKRAIPVRPTVHYTMGGIEVDNQCEAFEVKGLFAVGECSAVGLHGANRLGSNSLAEFTVFGRVAGENAAARALENHNFNRQAIDAQARDSVAKFKALFEQKGNENWAEIRKEMANVMEEGCGIYRNEELLQNCVNKINDLRERYKRVQIKDRSSVFNTEALYFTELGYLLDVAQATSYSALLRKESRGAHQRLDFVERDDVNYLAHTQAIYNPQGAPIINYTPVKITTSQPAARLYGDAGNKEH